jgi:uncharacterized protein YjdB
VDANGLVIAHAVGEAIITVVTTDGSNLSATCALSVTPQSAMNLEISQNSASMVVDNTLQLSVRIAPENTTTKTVSWTSSDETIATVDASGLVTAHKVGTATITVATTDGSNLSASCDLAVTPRLISSLAISSGSVSVAVDSTFQLTATIAPDNATNKAVTWTSSNESVATVDAAGYVITHQVGSATITVATTDGSNLSASCDLTVTPQAVTGLTLSLSATTMLVDKTLQLSATITPDNATTKAVLWISSDETVATVDGTGLVTAYKVGLVTITAATTDGSNLSATCLLTVTPQEVTGLTLSQESATVVVDNTLQLSATITPDNATNKTVSWTSSNETVATVDDSGLITAHKVGTATITVATTDGSMLSATCSLTVTPQFVSSLQLSQTTASVVVDHTLQLSATVAPDNATTKKILWTSSDKQVATVDETGLVTAYKVGVATITVSTVDGSNLSASCEITVTPQFVEWISLSETEVVLNVGDSYVLDAMVLPYNATDKTLDWASSDSSIVRVEQGKLVAISEGTASILVTATDGSGVQAICEVEVRDVASGLGTVLLNHVGSFRVYTIGGLLIRANVTREDIGRLAPGCYIINGRKTLIK